MQKNMNTYRAPEWHTIYACSNSQRLAAPTPTILPPSPLRMLCKRFNAPAARIHTHLNTSAFYARMRVQCKFSLHVFVAGLRWPRRRCDCLTPSMRAASTRHARTLAHTRTHSINVLWKSRLNWLNNVWCSRERAYPHTYTRDDAGAHRAHALSWLQLRCSRCQIICAIFRAN